MSGAGSTHHYQPAPASAVWQTAPPCAVCDMPRAHRVHTVPDSDPDRAALEARRLGERKED